MQGGGAAVRKLPTINLARRSSRCAQNNDRTVRAAEMAQAFKQAGRRRSPGSTSSTTCMYFNNLDAPLPTPSDDVDAGAVRRARRVRPRATSCRRFRGCSIRAPAAILPAAVVGVLDLADRRRHVRAARWPTTRDAILPYTTQVARRGRAGAAAVARRHRRVRRPADQDLHGEPFDHAGRRRCRTRIRSSIRAGRSRPRIRPRTWSSCPIRSWCRTSDFVESQARRELPDLHPLLRSITLT